MKALCSLWLLKIIFLMQKALLLVCYMMFCKVRPEKGLWVLGVDEIACVLARTAPAFDKSYTVNFSSNKYYQDAAYDFDIRKVPLIPSAVSRMIAGPVLLAYLMRRAEGFFYIWDTGFLIEKIDRRAFEFSFLKKHNKKLANFFVGSDIRSPILMQEFARKNNIDVAMTYLVLFDSFKWQIADRRVKKTAEVADRYADYIFNIPVDQMSYLQKDCHHSVLSYPDDQFFRDDLKFTSPDIIQIFHAPSSPFTKGTQLVRAAIKQLQVMGYAFNYVESLNEPNDVILAHLRKSHIVVNELYAFVPGMFGLEAMASHCALVTSADRRIETTLPEGAETAWVSTQYWEIFDHLKMLLDQPELIQKYADQGYEWAYKNCSASAVKKTLRTILQLEDAGR